MQVPGKTSQGKLLLTSSLGLHHCLVDWYRSCIARFKYSTAYQITVHIFVSALVAMTIIHAWRE